MPKKEHLLRLWQINFLVMYTHILLPILHYMFVNMFPYWNICTCSLSKRYLTCIPHEHIPFWQQKGLSDFAISGNVNLFVHDRLNKLLLGSFLYTFREGSFVRKKTGGLRDEVLQMLVDTSQTNFHFYQKKNYTISLNKNWLKSLFNSVLSWLVWLI